MGTVKSEELGMSKSHFIGQMSISLTPLLYTIITYYSWKSSSTRTEMLRAFIAAIPSHPTFNLEEFKKFANERMRPQFEAIDADSAEMLDRDLKALLESQHTGETSPVFEILALTKKDMGNN